MNQKACRSEHSQEIRDSRWRVNLKANHNNWTYGEPYLPSPSLCRCIVLKSMRGKVIGHGANKMKKNGKNTKVNTQHSQNKPYITCKAGRYSTRGTQPSSGARPWALSASRQFPWQVRMLRPWQNSTLYRKGLQRTEMATGKAGWSWPRASCSLTWTEHRFYMVLLTAGK